MLFVVSMRWIDPHSSTFERSEAMRLAFNRSVHWQQAWVDYAQISNNIKRAVIALEDGDFINHNGVEWQAIESAYNRNAQTQEAFEKAQEEQEKRQALAQQKEEQRIAKQTQSNHQKPKITQKVPKLKTIKPPKIQGGSTITQQLAKNLFLSGERNYFRKAQELIITFMLEAFLSKRRILEIYLNHVEWGEGVFGIQAAAQHYYHKSATDLSPQEAAKLAAMLTQPKAFEKQLYANRLSRRTQIALRRMGDAEIP